MKNPMPTSLLLALVAAISLTFPVAAQALVTEPGFINEKVVGGLNTPTALTFTKDGRIFIAEKGGRVRVVQDGVLHTTPVITLSHINTHSDRGLLGIAADPQFETNGYLYLSYTYDHKARNDLPGEKSGRIVRVTVVNNHAAESSMYILVGRENGTREAPSCESYGTPTVDCIPSDSPSHSVGGLRFGPDGKLYASLGDGANFDGVDPRALRAQNIDSLAGKFLRLNPDGTGPADNPFYNGDPHANRSKVFALGMRNAFRFNFHPSTGDLYAGDVGWASFEEINRIEAGNNYGWPCYEGAEKTRYNCESSSTPTLPVYSYAHDDQSGGSIVAGAFPFGDIYPAKYTNSMFIGDFAQNWIKRIVFDEAGIVTSVHNFDMSTDTDPGPYGPVDVTTAPNGEIYYIAIYTGEVRRLLYTPSNRPPIALIQATPLAGLAPLSVDFSSEGSTDPDGDAITYAWDFGDGASSTLANPTHVYTIPGIYTATLTLTDSEGAEATKSVTITANNQPPYATITLPVLGTTYTPGQRIDVAGTATDYEDGALPASAFHWDIILHHNTHTHLHQQFEATTTGFFIAPDHDTTDVHMEIKLTVTDSAGLTHTASTDIHLATTTPPTHPPTTGTSTATSTPPTTGGSRGGGGGGGGRLSRSQSVGEVLGAATSTRATTTKATSTPLGKNWVHVIGPHRTHTSRIADASKYGKPYFTYGATNAYLLKAHKAQDLIILVAGSGSLLQTIDGSAQVYTHNTWRTVPLTGVRKKNADGTYTGMAYYLLRSTDPLYSRVGAFTAKVTMNLPGCDNATCNINQWLLQEFDAK